MEEDREIPTKEMTLKLNPERTESQPYSELGEESAWKPQGKGLEQK